MNPKEQKLRKRRATGEPTTGKKSRKEKAQKADEVMNSNEQSSQLETKMADAQEPALPSTSVVASTSTDTIKGKKGNVKAKVPSSKTAKPPNRSVLQLKITLQGVTPPIWRRIQVLNNDTFYDLRQNINQAMGWISDRSHQFIIQNPKKNGNILVVNGALEGLTYDFKKDRGRLIKEQTTKLSKYLISVGDVILYEFDLAESWIHHVVVERVLPPPPPKAWFPKCKAGKRACPPEDCGGVDGYNHLIEVYNDPSHQEYDELINGWLQDMYPGYDPEKFDHKQIFKRVWMWLPG